MPAGEAAVRCRSSAVRAHGGRHSGTGARQAARLRARLAGRLEVVDRLVTLPRSGRRYWILAPAEPDRLLAAAEDDPEQRLPYWTQPWPSGLALADAALARFADLAGRPVLELGSGLGVTATAAIEAGAEVLATDYSPLALLLCRHNALDNARRAPRTLVADWRAPGTELSRCADAAGGFPVILGADILYEEGDIAPLLALVERLLAPDGRLWLAEPGRDPARRFLAALAASGWRDAVEVHDGPWPDGDDDPVRVHTLRRPG